MNPSPQAYRAIVLWARAIAYPCSPFKDYIKSEQKAASAANAPLDAIYEGGSRWITVRDLHPDHAVRQQWEREQREIQEAAGFVDRVNLNLRRVMGL